MYINDLYFLAENTNFCNYTDKATFYACDSDLHNLILEHDSNLGIEWFKCNYRRLLKQGHKYENVSQILVLAKFGKARVKNFWEPTLIAN